MWLGCNGHVTWVAGIGYDVLVDILKHISPSHVVNICISAKRKNLPSGAFWSQDGDAGAATVIEINSARQDSLNRSYVSVSCLFPFIITYYTCSKYEALFAYDLKLILS